jgi:hypothetical protein
MAGFFDFIKKPQSGTVTPVPADTAGAPVQTQTTQVVTQEEVVTHGGGSYNGIGNPPGGQAYNGIGNPPTPQIPQTTETVTTTQTTPTVPSQVPTAPTDAASAQPETINNTTNNKDATKETKNVAENAQKDQTKKEAVDQKAGETKNGDTPKVAGGPAALQSTIDQKKRDELDLMTHLTQRSNRVFLSAQNKAKELNGELVDSEHLLHGLLSDSEIYKLFSDLKIYPQVIEQERRAALEAKEMNETFNKPAQFQTGVMEYAASIGITIIDKPGIFLVQSMINPSNQVTAQKYYSPTQNTKQITVEKHPSGGILVTIIYKRNNAPQTEILTFRTNEKAEMRSSSSAFQGVAPQFVDLFKTQ